MKLVPITNKNVMSYLPFIPTDFRDILGNRDVMAIGVNKDTEKDGKGNEDEDGCLAIGALLFQYSSNSVQLLSIFVKQEYRFMGAGKLLLHKMKELCQKKQITNILVSYPLPAMFLLQLFFKHCGFQVIGEENIIYTVAVQDFERSGILESLHAKGVEQIRAVKEVPYELMYGLKKRFGKEISEELSPQGIGGKFLNQVSMAYCGKNQVKAYTACSELDNGMIYLGAVYADKEAMAIVIPLIRKTLQTILELYPDRKFIFAGATEAGKRIAKRLVQNREAYVQVQTMTLAMWKL